MASLSIRNLTTTPLELKHIARFEGEAVGGSGIANITSAIGNLFNGTKSAAVKPKGDEPTSHEDVSGVTVQPFTEVVTDIRAADPGREVLRLTFEEPGTSHRYTVDVPSPSPRSVELGREGDAPGQFTAVYSVGGGGHVAIYSSASLASWMRELSDGHSLSALSIPGTHNSPTCYVALPSVRCQAVGVREQLDNGVRFMDIRVSVNTDNDELTLVHSVFPISLTGSKYFRDLLSDVYAFLDANPSEVLLMSIKREGTGKGTDQQLSRYLKDRYFAGDAERRWFTEPRIPTLGESRGQVILVRRFNVDDSLHGEHGGTGWGVDGSSWPDNCADGTVGSGLIRVQDFYEVDQSTNIEKKIELARAQLERAAQQEASAGSLPIFVNFLSASNFFNASCWPEKIAAKVNPAVVEYLCMRHGEQAKGPSQLPIGDAATGIVVTDWVGQNGDWDLIRCIVGWNSRLQLRQ
ncbi:1-phosphatidylinositol phosphodiesterase [Thozetella sp. PMI_491]|nr:1-phosphatidylinositol phosphodiesterase [Thozetella sp. PMI_491]